MDVLLGVGSNVSKLGSLLSFFLMCGVANVPCCMGKVFYGWSLIPLKDTYFFIKLRIVWLKQSKCMRN